MKSFKEVLMKGRKVGEGPYKDAKMSMLKELRSVMGEEMGNDIKGLKKVTVASPDQEGLEEGLDKAKEIVEEMPEKESGMAEKMPEMDSETEEKEDEMPMHKSSAEEKIAKLEQELAELKKMLMS